MKLPVYFNASPLLLPKTGIRQYAWQLLKRVRHICRIDPHYFYLVGWSEELIECQGRDKASHLWQVKNLLRDVFPYSLEIQHKIREQLFRQGLKAINYGVYHELNFLSFKTDLPTVLTLHDLSILRFPEVHPAARVKFMERRLLDSVERASIVLTDSEYVRNEVIQEFSLPADKVITVALAASDEFVPLEDELVSPILLRYGVCNKKYLLAVGTLEPRKNLIAAISAYAALPSQLRREYPMLLAGMRGWDNHQFDSILQPMLSRGEIRVLGFVPESDLPVLYNAAVAFIYPSLYEGFGLPPLEAMACGTPVITSNRASLSELVGMAGIQIDPADIVGFREAISNLINDPLERARLSALGLQRSRQFSWDRTANETIAAYSAALKS